MRRLFTFGCSFTNYRWSTWADCLAPEFDYHENWGQSGAGNHYIFNSLIEADIRNHFGANDTVVVCWTTPIREDHYVDGRWHTLGNMTTCPIYNPDYLRSHVDARGYAIRDMAYIQAAKTLLENRLGINWQFLKVAEFDIDQDILQLYQTAADSVLPSYQQVLFKQRWPNHCGDPHPSPEEHLAYLDVVLPGWVTKQETRVKMHIESQGLNKDPNKSGMAKVTRL